MEPLFYVPKWVIERIKRHGHTTGHMTANVNEKADEYMPVYGEPAPAAPVTQGEREALRDAQRETVMPLIGPLLDAWEGAHQQCREDLPELDKWLRLLNRAMEDAPAAQPVSEPVLSDAQVRELRSAHGWAKDTIREIERAILALRPASQPVSEPDSRVEFLLRRLLAHRVAGVNGYYVDGELRDETRPPFIDFLRDHPKDIELKLAERREPAAPRAPLTKTQFARLWRERMGSTRFSDYEWEAKLITERAHGIIKNDDHAG